MKNSHPDTHPETPFLFSLLIESESHMSMSEVPVASGAVVKEVGSVAGTTSGSSPIKPDRRISAMKYTIGTDAAGKNKPYRKTHMLLLHCDAHRLMSLSNVLSSWAHFVIPY